MNKIETKKKNHSKKIENSKKNLVSSNPELREIERYYSVFGYHDYYLDEPENLNKSILSRFRVALTRFFSWIISFLNSFPL
jgi:hypothetical protein